MSHGRGLYAQETDEISTLSPSWILHNPPIFRTHTRVVLYISVSFWIPNIVQDPYKRDPKRDPNLENHLNMEIIMRNPKFKTLNPETLNFFRTHMICGDHNALNPKPLNDKLFRTYMIIMWEP